MRTRVSRCGRARAALALVAGLALWAAPARAQPEETVTIEALVERVRAEDWDAQGLASRLGPQAVPALAPLAKGREDYAVLAAVCVRLAGGPEAAQVGLDLLGHEDEQLRSEGLQILLAHPPRGRQAELLERYATTRDALLRDRLPDVAVRAGDADPAAWLAAERRRRGAQAEGLDDEALVRTSSDGLVAALSRQGDARARAEAAERLERARGEALRGWVGRLVEAGQPWPLPALARLLDREDVVFTVGADGRPQVDVRACDQAVWAIGKLAPRPLSFPVTPGARYAPAQVEEARRAATDAAPGPGGGEGGIIRGLGPG